MGRTSHTTLASQCAAVVAALIGTAALTIMALSGHPAAAATSPTPANPNTPGTPATPSGPPRYYADVEGSTIVVRATATGAITSQVSFHEGVIQALAAAGDDRTFYYVTDEQSFQRIMRFRLTAKGAITGLTEVRDGTLNPQAVADSLAVSPDGADLAVGEFFDPSPAGGGGPTAELVVVNQRTGKQTIWQGINHKNWPVSIPSVSWTRDGRSVVYLLQWCSKGLEGTDTCMSQSRQDQQVWTLDAASPGGSLAAHGHRLLASSARYPIIQQAIAAGRDGEIIVMVVSPNTQHGHLAIDLVSVPAGKTRTVLYHGAEGLAAGSSLSADASGAYLLLADGFGPHHGWIHGGALHLLPPTNGSGEPLAW